MNRKNIKKVLDELTADIAGIADKKIASIILDFSHFQFVPIPAGIGITLTP